MPFTKTQAKPGIRIPWVKNVVDKEGKTLPFYRSVLAQLDSLGQANGDLDALATALDEKDRSKTLELWRSVSKTPYSYQNAPTVQDLSAKYRGLGPKGLDSIAQRFSQLSPEYLREIWILAENAPMCAYLLPQIIAKCLKSSQNEAARQIIWTLSADSQYKREIRAVNFAVNSYLRSVEFSFEDLKQLLDGINSEIAPRLDETVTRKLCSLPRADLLPCFDYLRKRKIPLNKKGFSSFLRAVFASSDAASATIIDASKTTEYPPGFYHFLIRYLCQKKDTASLDWIFENSVMKMAQDMPEKLPFVLHLLVMRTIATDGVQATTPILDKMGEIPEPTWMIIFQEFRRLGRIDKCNETLHRALSRGHRLSLPFVGEYLEMVASFYNMRVYISCLQKILPEMLPTLERLGILALAETQSAQDVPALTVGKEVRGFAVNRIHESWLNITYKVVLNNVDDVEQIQHLFSAYYEYVMESQASISLATTDEFVAKLTSIKTPAAIDAAETILITAITDFPLQRAQKFTNQSKSLTSLLLAMTRSHRHVDLQRIVLLVNRVLACPAVSVRGTALQPLLEALKGHAEYDSIKEWAEQLGANFQ